LSNPLLKKQPATKVTQRQKVVTLLCSQLLLLLLSVFVMSWLNYTTALSVLVGGLIHWVPNGYFTLYAFRFHGAQAAILILGSMYQGEFGKLLLTSIGFALAFALLKSIVPQALFVAFIVMTISQWFLVSRW
jgi:ATP synthase protein I